MKSRLLFYTALFVLIPTFLCASSDHPEPKQGILKYLPEENELKKWKPLSSPQTAEGDDLFHLINGGAEIYHEYGFKRAVIQSYEHTNGLSLNIEIYEMEDPLSAYGVFSFKTGSKGQKKDVGMDALLEDYYLNFWKGEFVVTLIGFDTSPATQEALLEFAEKIESNLPERDRVYPPLINFLKNQAPESIRRVYLEGNLALYNQYEFDTENIFGIKKGAVSYFSDHILFLFEYNSQRTVQHWFENAWNQLKKNQQFHGFEKLAEGVFLQDNKSNSIFISPFQNFILIYLGKDSSKAKDRLKKLKKEIL
ncbi:MAG: DUF6599 family protein [Acidobacteriota bacterium]